MKTYVKKVRTVILMDTEDGYIIANEDNLDDEWKVSYDYFNKTYKEDEVVEEVFEVK